MRKNRNCSAHSTRARNFFHGLSGRSRTNYIPVNVLRAGGLLFGCHWFVWCRNCNQCVHAVARVVHSREPLGMDEFSQSALQVLPGIAVAYKTSTRVVNRPRRNQFCATPCRALALAEDPPFGGLWCDQPAPFSNRLLPPCVGEPANHRHKRVEVERLGDMQIKPRIHCRLDVAV